MDVSQYLEIFIDESSEHIQTLSDCIMTLEQEPENKDTINEIFRAAHSLKGMAGTMGFKRMQHLTHDMENVFQEVRSDKIKVDSSMIDLLFKCLDAIDSYVENIKSTSDEGTDDNEVIIKELNDFIAKANGQPVSKQEKPQETVTEAKAQASSDTSQNVLDTFELTNNEKNLIDEAISSGLKIYGMTVTVANDCLLKAARAFLVFRAVEELGQILVYRPSSQDIEDEKFDLSFSFYVASGEAYDKLEHAASNVSEIDKVFGKEITEFHIEGEAEQTAQACEETQKAQEKKEEKAETAKTETAKPKASNNSQKQTVSHKKATTSRTVRVDIEKLDMLMNQVSELIIAKNSLVAMSSSDGENNNNQSFHEQIEYLERITTNLHESVMKVRMVPIESVTQKYPRMIRDLSRTLNKKMNLVITGEDTELDRTVVDQIGDPLQHLLRNSADHGLESNEVRLERGKPEVGTIFLNAYQEGNNVVIKVGDDGNGINTEAVKAKAIERGIVTAEQAENLSQKDIINFLFMPSFSMAKQITDISGRGVGLDVVKSGIEQLGGDVSVSTELGKGTTFTVRLPLTLAIIQALMVEIRDEIYAIALGSISNIEDIPVKDIKYVQAKEVIHLRGSVIPIIRLDKMLDIEPKEQEPDHLTVVIVQKGDQQAGLVVDNLIGQQEIVIKSLGKYINGNKLISGATILGDGDVALILDVNTLM
ncbi:chemotaxis protein CheW [Agathobacter sp.]|uniref:chemotaxis protein CheW n=1 Tax=Agathobacter sp. TaxID=2021311 RepID=UPI003FD6FBE9